MSGWGVRWNPWSPNYSSLECEQMRFIHKSFCEAMDIKEEDLPPQLQMNESFSFPTYMPRVSDIDEHSFMRKMQNVVGLLRNPAESIISNICAYQKDRKQRIGFTGYLNDPRNLLLEEFKDWASRTLASASCTLEATLVDVRRRHGYILRLQHGQQGLFQPGSGDRSLLSTLKEVRMTIETRILPTIEAERAHSSAREQLHTLEARGIDGLIHGVQFLFYVFRNTPNVPDDCTISTLQNPHQTSMKDAMNSRSGTMLSALINTPSFRSLFPDHSTSPKQSVELMNSFGSTFIDSNGKSVIPHELLPKNSLSLDEDILPIEYLKKNSGLVTLTLNEESSLNAFTRLHGMLKLLADLLVSCRKARQLAGPGGDLLVYGPGGEEVRHLMQSCDVVQKEIIQLMDHLSRIGVKQLDRLRSGQSKNWRNSFSKVLPLLNYVTHDFQACVEPIQRIYASADPVHVKKMYQQFRQATGLWVKENYLICSTVNKSLGLPMLERKRYQVDIGENTIDKLQSSTRAKALLEDEVSSQIEEVDGDIGLSDKYKRSELNVASSNLQNVAEDEANIEEKEEFGEETDNSEGSSASGFVRFQTAAKLVSWASRGVDLISSTITTMDSEASLGENASRIDGKPKDDIVATDDTAPKVGLLDLLLVLRQSIQRISQLSWGIKNTLHTVVWEEDDDESFAIFCGIYEAAGVNTVGNLFITLEHHYSRLVQVCRLHIGSLLRCLFILQRRIVDNEKPFFGIFQVLSRLKSMLNNFQDQMKKISSNYNKNIVNRCIQMRNGIMEHPDVNPHGEGPGILAFESISSLTKVFSGRSTKNAAIFSHEEYMKQLCSRLETHQMSITHLSRSLEVVDSIVSDALNMLKDHSALSREGDIFYFHQQIDYIFECNYDRFFEDTTKDLQLLTVALSRENLQRA